MSFNLFNRGNENKESEKKTLEDFIRKEDEEECEPYEDMADVEIPNEEEQKKDEARHESEEEGLNALSCFGWREEKTEKWLVKCAKVWFLMMSLLYFVFGALTFAPIIFIQNKVNSVLKDKKMSLIIAVVIYAIVVVLFAILIGSRCGAQEAIDNVNNR
jgi:hypothetical protein